MDILELNNSLIPHYMDFCITTYYTYMYTSLSGVFRQYHINFTSLWYIILRHHTFIGHAMAQLALRYKPECRGFDFRWCHWNFSLTLWPWG
jgi:hypothetical protein